MTIKRLIGAWGKGLVARTHAIQLYDLRHGWAIRSIRRNLNASPAATTIGPSLNVHHRPYHRWLEVPTRLGTQSLPELQ